MQIKQIAYIRSDFVEKFGIPRQSNLADTRAEIHFLPEYQNADALREIEAYDYLWLIWEFSESIRDTWSPTVRPPRLGGNRRVGVFATRSPFRPNPIGLSSVKLIGVEFREKEGPVLIVEGADLLDMTPIYDIKPYLPYVDSHPEAKGGFAEEKKDYKLDVNFPEMYLEQIPPRMTFFFSSFLSAFFCLSAPSFFARHLSRKQIHGIRKIPPIKERTQVNVKGPI